MYKVKYIIKMSDGSHIPDIVTLDLGNVAGKSPTFIQKVVYRKLCAAADAKYTADKWTAIEVVSMIEK